MTHQQEHKYPNLVECSKPYPHYKDSVVEWLGQIPVHWEVKRLKFAADIIAGQSPPSEVVSTFSNRFPFLQGNAEFGSINPMPQLACEGAPKTAQVDDILLSVRAPVGAINIADQVYRIGRGLCAIHPTSVLESRFTYYLLLVLRDGLRSQATGSTYDAVTVGSVANLSIALPPLWEERAIATFLDRETAKIDALVAKKERLIELLQEKRTALITRAVTKGLDPDGKMKDSGVEWLGKIPAAWKVAPVYTRYKVALGKMLDAKRISGNYLGQYVRNIDVQWDSVNTDDLPQMDFSPEERDRYKLEAGDLLVCEGGDVGRTAIWEGNVGDCFYQKALHRVRPHSNEDIPRFFYYVMYALAKGGVFVAGGNPNTIDHLTAIQLSHYRFPFPPSEEQAAIAIFLDHETTRIDALIDKIRAAIDRLKELRAALISAAVTGKIDVRDEADPTPGVAP